MKWWQIVGGVILVLIIGAVVVNMLTPPAPAPTESEWDAIRAADVAVFTSEWGLPVRIAASDAGWEDSANITPDGQRLYFTYYPGDLLSDFSTRKFVDDLDIYYSDFPFTSKVKDTRFFMAEDIWSEVGPTIDSQGNIFYNSNRDYLNDKKSDQDVWMNGERLLFNDAIPDSEWGNPFYDEATDTLWLDELDTKMWMLKNAKANNFSGTPVLAPAPLQVDGYSNFQPWLSSDGLTIYFSTNRGEVPNLYGPQIYMSTRTGDTWATPKLVGYSKIGMGEATLTADGKRLYFVQLFSDGKGHYTSDMFYVERKS